jgi:hypothetical protein
MDKQTQFVTQYQDLRDDIKQTNIINNQTIGIVMTAGITQDNSVIRLSIFFIVYAITIPGYRFLRGNRRHIWRVSTYIRVFLEPKLEEMQWETRLDLQRKLSLENKNHRFTGSSFVNTNEWFIIFLLNTIAALAAIFLGIATMPILLEGKIMGIIIIILGNILLFILTNFQEKNLRRGGKIEENYYLSWLKVKEAQSTKTAKGVSS